VKDIRTFIRRLQRLKSKDARRREAFWLLTEIGHGGATFRQAAAAVGVHPSTLARWQRLDPLLQRLVRCLGDSARAWRRLRRPQRPAVPWHRGCPACGGAAEVRTALFGARFWRCSRWPACGWASWRPRHPEDCPACGGPRYWSPSRKRIDCPGCGPGPAPAAM
jgi:hypothetical protein